MLILYKQALLDADLDIIQKYIEACLDCNQEPIIFTDINGVTSEINHLSVFHTFYITKIFNDILLVVVQNETDYNIICNLGIKAKNIIIYDTNDIRSITSHYQELINETKL